jgi:hypothetical protein
VSAPIQWSASTPSSIGCGQSALSVLIPLLMRHHPCTSAVAGAPGAE